jgi:hypothetical protein
MRIMNEPQRLHLSTSGNENLWDKELYRPDASVLNCYATVDPLRHLPHFSYIEAVLID